MILEQLMQGAPNKHIARELNIADATVKVHLKSLLRKIRVDNRTQAAMWGRDRVPPNGQLQQSPVSSSCGDSDTTSGTIPNGDETASRRDETETASRRDETSSRSGSRAAAGVGQVLAEIDFKGGFDRHN